MKIELRRTLSRCHRLLSRIWIRLLAFNLLLVFLPAAALFYFDVYERKLLEAQERSMVQQGRLLAAALAHTDQLDHDAVAVLSRLDSQTISRLRIIDWRGTLLADSSHPAFSHDVETKSDTGGIRDHWLYRLGKTFFWLSEGALGSRTSPPDPSEPLALRDFQNFPEIRQALSGKYGAAWRVSPGQRSVTLYSAIPIWRENQIAGAVLVSQSTLRVLQDLYDVRLTVFKIVLASFGAAALLSLLVATTIASPLRDLRRKASTVLDRRDELKHLFRGSSRNDEIGDLNRALEQLSVRLHDRIQFIESFASDLSHELKNPLTSIRNATELLQQVQDPDERGRFLSLVDAEVARMERLLSKTREVTFIDANLEKEARSVICLNHFIPEFLSGFSLGRGNKTRLKFVELSRNVCVAASTDRLGQMLENVLDNALGFAPEGSEVSISLARWDGYALISMADQGPGIPKEHLGRIFSRFFSHRPNETKSTSSHVGLGLAIVKAIVEGYGGSVLARNIAEGGAVFEIRLPMA